jgi:hypothetical protein
VKIAKVLFLEAPHKAYTPHGRNPLQGTMERFYQGELLTPALSDANAPASKQGVGTARQSAQNLRLRGFKGA